MRILLSRWVQTLLGTVLLAGLVWVFGPLLPPLEPWLIRVLVIQSMLILWAVANALIDLRRRSRSAALTAGLAMGSEAEAVGQTLTKALALLKKSGKRNALAELPWYAIIGPPGAGKTTALLNAGLTFTFAEQLGQAAIAGTGGTRMCEWWFTKDAVLIDTAGRYTTQDSNASVDQAGWEAFLGLLKRTRPRQPLNGVIVAIALPEVVQGSVAERNAHAAAVNRRIAELEERLGLRMPVYALFTKADLIAGFSEFFDNLDRKQRDQVWGETYPLVGKTEALAERFGASLRGLVARLNERLLQRLQAEHRLDRQGAIAGFPTQLASVEKPLAAFTAMAFPATTMLRGVYFASGTQEGTPIDRLTGAMARVFGIDQAARPALRPEQGRSYFLGQLLRDVILGEAMLVREAPGAVRRRALRRSIGFAVVALVALAAIGFVGVTYRSGQQQIAAIADGLAQYEQSAQGVALDPVNDGDLQPVVALLDQAQALAGVTPDARFDLGMGQAGKLTAGAGAVYRDGLIYGLLPRLVWRLEAQMRGSLDRPETLYGQTRIYLMLGGVGPLNPGQVREWMVADWAQSYPAPEDAPLRASLAQHLDRLLAQPLPPITLDGPLVAQARASIAAVPLARRVYASIRSSSAATSLPPWRPFDSLGLAGSSVFARASGKPMTDGIAGVFTADGFRKVVVPSVASATKAVAAETWVTGRTQDYAPAELQELGTAVTRLYFADFVQQWDAMLSDLNIAPMISLPQAAQALYIISSPESPMRALIRSIAAQVQVPPGDPPDAAAVQAGLHFKGLTDLVTGDGAGLERSLRLVADIQQQLAKIAALPVGTPIPSGGEDIGNAVQADAARQPQPFARWLLAVSGNAVAMRTGNARRQAIIAYNAPGGPALTCQAAVTGHYPFTPNGTPLPLDEFARVFATGGMLDGFFNTQLKPYVDMSSKPWKPQPAGTAPAPVAAPDVAQFQRAAAIREAFFPAGSATPSVQVEVTPLGQERRAATLAIGGIILQGGGPAHTAQIAWPPTDPTATAILSADPSAPPLPLSEDGPWALFRLFARGRLAPAGKNGKQTLTFPANPPISYEVKTVGETSPFMPGLFTDFRCPGVQ